MSALCNAVDCFICIQDPASDERFHVELHFSPGAYTVGQDMKDPAGPGFKSQMKEHEKKVTYHK